MGSSAVPTLVVIALVAVAAPIISEGLRRYVAVPEVVILILLGIVVGPYVLDIAHTNSIVTALSDLGLTFLMFLAGAELDVTILRQGRAGLAVMSWFASLAIALALAAVLHGSGLVIDTVVPALCLTTTALGTLLPMLRDSGVLRSSVGPIVLSVGAVGEFGPIVAVAILLTSRDAGVTVLLLALFVAVAVASAMLAAQVHPPRLVRLLRRHLNSTSQLPVRISVLLVVLLVYLAFELSLDVLLGAFAAGMVVRLFITGEDYAVVTSKLEAIGFGFLIPVFFIESGVKFDLGALLHRPRVLLLVPLFALLFLVTRGVPSLLFFRRVLATTQRRALAVLSATGLPIIVVITTLGVEEHRMKPQNAAALVAAGMLSVLIYPVIGLGLLRRSTTLRPTQAEQKRTQTHEEPEG
jgi:Kef-type K+ transport system membrane component KefB